MEGERTYRHYEVEERRAIFGRVPELHPAHMDPARAWVRRGNPEAAAADLQQAMVRGYFPPGLAYNLPACVGSGSSSRGGNDRIEPDRHSGSTVNQPQSSASRNS